MHFFQIKHMTILISALTQHSAAGYFEAVFFIKHPNERNTIYKSVRSSIKFLLKKSIHSLIHSPTITKPFTICPYLSIFTWYNSSLWPWYSNDIGLYQFREHIKCIHITGLSCLLLSLLECCFHVYLNDEFLIV